MSLVTANPTCRSVARPLETRIERSQPAPDSVCFHIPRSGNWGGLFWIAIVWNAFHWFCAIMFVAISIQQSQALEPESKDIAGLVIMCILLPIFILVGLWFIFMAIWHRFSTARLELSPDSICLHLTLFGKTKTRSVSASEVRHVDLVEFYKRCGKPVNGIRIETGHASLCFGSALKDDEKDWLISEIRDFLHRNGYPSKASNQGTAHPLSA